ncbi:MAG: ribonuclease III [Caulobacterales bacterium 68-7]|nr:ribonuclease III [Caulobacterales bacterium]OJU08920.1 MAG: ribonuclease III [Caulobacterales bacterium 68-7]
MNARATAVHTLEARIGYTFKDRELLERALTHASTGEGARKTANNEVLEFVGDRVLGLLVAEALARRYPDATEGKLAPIYNGLVSRETCARVARGVDLGSALRMSASATKMGARDRTSVLAGACEALIAAVYRDSDLETTRGIFTVLWREAFADDNPTRGRDAKSALQEWAQAAHRSLPVYAVVDRSGPDHAPIFTVEVTVDSLPPQAAQGASRQVAEKAAAQALLIREGLWT